MVVIITSKEVGLFIGRCQNSLYMNPEPRTRDGNTVWLTCYLF